MPPDIYDISKPLLYVVHRLEELLMGVRDCWSRFVAYPRGGIGPLLIGAAD